jgi:hypothetical protein
MNCVEFYPDPRICRNSFSDEDTQPWLVQDLIETDIDKDNYGCITDSELVWVAASIESEKREKTTFLNKVNYKSIVFINSMFNRPTIDDKESFLKERIDSKTEEAMGNIIYDRAMKALSNRRFGYLERYIIASNAVNDFLFWHRTLIEMRRNDIAKETHVVKYTQQAEYA